LDESGLLWGISQSWPGGDWGGWEGPSFAGQPGPFLEIAASEQGGSRGGEIWGVGADGQICCRVLLPRRPTRPLRRRSPRLRRLAFPVPQRRPRRLRRHDRREDERVPLSQPVSHRATARCAPAADDGFSRTLTPLSSRSILSFGPPPIR
jgi:hypothetical protein